MTLAYSKYSSIYVHKTSLGYFREVGAYFPLHFYRTQFAYIKSLKQYSKIKNSICVCVWGGGGEGGDMGSTPDLVKTPRAVHLPT